MKQPHDNWGAYYDYVYEQSFGPYYNELTAETLKLINQILPHGSIIDFGAGTGRLAIPLAKQGYSVIAVEKSKGMVNELNRKINEQKTEMELHNCSICEYNNASTKLALALFTVLSYSTSIDELSANLKNICKHIESGGYFFFDLPNTVFFSQGRLLNIERGNFRRIVELISNEENDVYTYHERCLGNLNGNQFSYEDSFRIKYWQMNIIDMLLQENGMHDTKMSFPEFQSTGSTYKLYRKQ